MENRADKRHGILLRVDYRSGDALLSDYATDVGRGGLFVRTEHPFSVGMRVMLCISFPGVLEPTEVAAIVRWRRSAEQSAQTGEPQGVGVAFAPDSKEALAKIASLSARLAQTDRTVLRSKSLDVLMVEDNRFVQDLFRQALKVFREARLRRGAEPMLRMHVAFTGHEALRMLQSVKPQLAIVDHLLPGMTGARLIQHMRADERFREVPILMLSAGGKQARSEAMEAGATVYLDKPVPLAQLVATIEAMLSEEA